MTNSAQPAAASLPALDTDYLETLTPAELSTLFASHAGLWPYSARANILDRETALDIRILLLQWMNEAELNSYSVGELIDLYCEFLHQLLDDFCSEAEERTHDPAVKVRAMKAAVAAVEDCVSSAVEQTSRSKASPIRTA
jgi:hypothetical protein